MQISLNLLDRHIFYPSVVAITRVGSYKVVMKLTIEFRIRDVVSLEMGMKPIVLLVKSLRSFNLPINLLSNAFEEMGTDRSNLSFLGFK